MEILLIQPPMCWEYKAFISSLLLILPLCNIQILKSVIDIFIIIRYCLLLSHILYFDFLNFLFIKNVHNFLFIVSTHMLQ